MFKFIVRPAILFSVTHVNIAPFVRNELSSLLNVTATIVITVQKFR